MSVRGTLRGRLRGRSDPEKVSRLMLPCCRSTVRLRPNRTSWRLCWSVVLGGQLQDLRAAAEQLAGVSRWPQRLHLVPRQDPHLHPALCSDSMVSAAFSWSLSPFTNQIHELGNQNNPLTNQIHQLSNLHLHPEICFSPPESE